MPTTQTYLEQLIANSNAAATAKKAALDQAYERMTTATFDESGNPTYKKDEKGNTLYGSMDVDYLNKVRQTGAGAESAGMLRSGQYARSLAEGQAAYRAGVIGAQSQTTAEKTAIDQETAQKQAEYKATYGSVGGGGGGGGGTSTGSSTGGTTTGRNTGITTPPSMTSGITPGATTTRTAPTTNLTPQQQAGLATRNKVAGGFGATKTPTTAAAAKTPAQATGSKPVPAPKPVTTKPGQRVIRPGQVR